MRIFPNTAAWNDRLWKIKHLIELRPLTFPKGEPTMDDVRYTEIRPDGRLVFLDSLNKFEIEFFVLFEFKFE